MKIILLTRPNIACDYHRIVLPFRFLPLEDGERLTIISDDQEITAMEFKDANLVIFNRLPTMEMSHLLALKDRFRFKIWCDVDDYWKLYKGHYLHDAWKKSKTEDKITKSINIADIVTVTNRRLLRAVLPLNSNVRIIPNALPIGFDQFLSQKEESTKIRFMYAGGPSHAKDLASIEKLLQLISRSTKFHEKTEFILAGYNEKYKEPELHEMNRIMGLAPRYTTLPGLPVNEYMNHYNSADICLSPLVENEFNQMKSNLKVIEAGCMRCPIICTDTYPYLEDIEMKGNGIFFCKDYKEWHNVCNYLVDNPTLIVQFANKLYNYVKEKYDLLEVNKIRRQIINSFK